MEIAEVGVEVDSQEQWSWKDKGRWAEKEGEKKGYKCVKGSGKNRKSECGSESTGKRGQE